MKIVAIALSLGCTAIVGTLAVRSESFTVNPHPSSSLLHLPWFEFLPIPAPVEWAWGPRQNRAAALPSVSKAETLTLISGAASRYRVPKEFVASIVAAESNFDSTAVSDKGAIGLMQLMPETAREFGADPNVPAENIDAGTHYLHWLMARYQNRSGAIERVIAAYNAGPGMVDRYRGIPPFHETRTYVARVMGFLKQFSPVRKPIVLARSRRG